MNEGLKEATIAAATAAVRSTSIIVLIVLFLKFNLLGHVLAQVRSLSIVTHICLIQVIFPQIVLEFYSKIFAVVSFDLMEEYLYVEDILEYLFNLNDVAFSKQAEELGYASEFTISNLSSIMILFPATLLIQSICYLVTKLACCCRRNKIITTARAQHDAFIWNGLIAFFNESYILLCFCAVFNVHAARKDADSLSH